MQKGAILHNSVLPSPAARQHCNLTSDDFTDEAKSLLTPGLNTQLTVCFLPFIRQINQINYII